MSRWRIFSMIVLAAACLLCAEVPVAAARAEDWLMNETRALLRVVRQDDNGKPGRCEFEDHWDETTPIPGEIAEKHFGVRLRAGLVAEPPSAEWATLATILDPSGENRKAFCSKSERGAYEAALKERADSAAFRRSTYSFPIFDRKFRRAAIVVGHYLSGFRKSSDGSVKSIPGEFVIRAEIYAKVKGVWRKIDSLEIAIT
jgi:hypothetical protein